MPLLTLASSIQAETQKSNRGSAWHRRCCTHRPAHAQTLLTHATTLVVTRQHTLRWSPWFNYVKKTDAIGYIANQTNEYLYTQSILTYTQVCKHHTSVHIRIHRHDMCMAHRYTQECKCCATGLTWVPPKGVITIHIDTYGSHIFLPKYD